MMLFMGSKLPCSLCLANFGVGPLSPRTSRRGLPTGSQLRNSSTAAMILDAVEPLSHASVLPGYPIGGCYDSAR